MNTPALGDLKIQLAHIERQAQQICSHLEELILTASGNARAHLEHAAANCFGIETLASHVHACVTCADKAAAPLSVCASDEKPGVV